VGYSLSRGEFRISANYYLPKWVAGARHFCDHFWCEVISIIDNRGEDQYFVVELSTDLKDIMHPLLKEEFSMMPCWYVFGIERCHIYECKKASRNEGGADDEGCR
jgi:hypothetical protein